MSPELRVLFAKVTKGSMSGNAGETPHEDIKINGQYVNTPEKGLVAGLLKKRMATLASDENIHAVRLFASFFVPFYFFHEGLEVPAGALVLKALFYGVAFSAVLIPIRVAKCWAECHYFSGRTSKSGVRVAIALTPTLIFTLVIAGILHETFHIDDSLYGGLLVYAAISTILPSFVLPGLAEMPSADMPINPMLEN